MKNKRVIRRNKLSNNNKKNKNNNSNKNKHYYMFQLIVKIMIKCLLLYPITIQPLNKIRMIFLNSKMRIPNKLRFPIKHLISTYSQIKTKKRISMTQGILAHQISYLPIQSHKIMYINHPTKTSICKLTNFYSNSYKNQYRLTKTKCNRLKSKLASYSMTIIYSSKRILISKISIKHWRACTQDKLNNSRIS